MSMKLRMLDSSVRLRLTPEEVEIFGRGGRLESTACFPNGGVFAYALSVTVGDAMTARFDDDCIEVQVPRPAAAQWAHGDEVSLSAEQLTTGGVFRILVEKDFHAFPPREGDPPEGRCSTPRTASIDGPVPSLPVE
jgi:hypothetical protein